MNGKWSFISGFQCFSCENYEITFTSPGSEFPTTVVEKAGTCHLNAMDKDSVGVSRVVTLGALTRVSDWREKIGLLGDPKLSFVKIIAPMLDENQVDFSAELCFRQTG
jgi:hypothetical protein